LALLQLDGRGVEPDQKIGDVLFLETKCHVVYNDKPALLRMNIRTQTRSCECTVFGNGDLPGHGFGSQFSNMCTSDTKEDAIRSL
jgi:hypothetical protein